MGDRLLGLGHPLGDPASHPAERNDIEGVRAPEPRRRLRARRKAADAIFRGDSVLHGAKDGGHVALDDPPAGARTGKLLQADSRLARQSPCERTCEDARSLADVSRIVCCRFARLDRRHRRASVGLLQIPSGWRIGYRGFLRRGDECDLRHRLDVAGAFRHEDPLQHSFGLGLDLDHGLVGLDVADVISGLDAIPLLSIPLQYGARFGHHHGRSHPASSSVRIVLSLRSEGRHCSVWRIAASIVCCVGIVARSSSSLYGIGICGAPTRTIGASSQSNAFSWTNDATSAPKPKRVQASCTTTKRWVLRTESRINSSSSGYSVRGSMTSTEIPSFAMRLAAARALGTIDIVAT